MQVWSSDELRGKSEFTGRANFWNWDELRCGHLCRRSKFSSRGKFRLEGSFGV